MPGEPVLVALLTSVQPRTRAVHLSARRSRPPRICHRSAPAHPARAARRGCGRTPGDARRTLSRRRPPPAADLRHLLQRHRADSAAPISTSRIRAVYVPVEPADPFVEAIRTAQEIGAQNRLRRSRFHRASARSRYLSRFVRAQHHHALRNTWKPIGSTRAANA